MKPTIVEYHPGQVKGFARVRTAWVVLLSLIGRAGPLAGAGGLVAPAGLHPARPLPGVGSAC